MSAKDLLKQKNWIMLNKMLIHNLGLNAAIFIGELCDKEEAFDKDGQWFYLSREKITEDIGLSSDMQRKACDILIEAGILEMTFTGMPARNHYKINDDALLYWLMEERGEQQQAVENTTASHSDFQQQAVENATACCTEMQRHAVEKSYLSKDYIKRQENPDSKIQKEPEPEAPSFQDSSQRISSKRNFRQEHEKLEDVLESGRDIDTQKQKKKRSPAEKMRDDCLGEIDSRNFDDETKELLKEYFEWASSGKDVRRIKGLDLWKSKLNALEQIVKRTGERADAIVKQSMDNGWYKFEELNKPATKKSTHEPLADKVEYRSAEEAQKDLDAKRADPNQKWY